MREGNVQHDKGETDIGIQTAVYLQPDTVSFQFLYYKELDARTYATGAWSCFNGKSHNPNQGLIPVGADEVGYGSLIGDDEAESSYCGSYSKPFPDSVESLGIPSVYALDPDGPTYPAFSVTLQTAKLTPTGNLSMKKGAAIGRTTVASPTSEF